MAFRIDKYSYAVAFKYHVFRLYFIDKFQCLSHTGAAAGFHAQTDAFAFAAFGKKGLDVVGGGFG